MILGYIKFDGGRGEETKAEGKKKSRVTVGLDSGTETPRRVARPRRRQQKNDPHTFFSPPSVMRVWVS